MLIFKPRTHSRIVYIDTFQKTGSNDHFSYCAKHCPFFFPFLVPVHIFVKKKQHVSESKNGVHFFYKLPRMIQISDIIYVSLRSICRFLAAIAAKNSLK